MEENPSSSTTGTTPKYQRSRGTASPWNVYPEACKHLSVCVCVCVLPPSVCLHVKLMSCLWSLWHKNDWPTWFALSTHFIPSCCSHNTQLWLFCYSHTQQQQQQQPHSGPSYCFIFSLLVRNWPADLMQPCSFFFIWNHLICPVSF